MKAITDYNLQRREFDTEELASIFRKPSAIFGSWGLEQITESLGNYITLKVNGHHHTGYVYIVLDYNDTFLLLYVDLDYNVVDEQKGVYIEDLIETIDVRVEKIESYG